MTNQLTFSDHEREVRQAHRGRTRSQQRLDVIERSVDWDTLAALLEPLTARSAEARKKGGRPRYSPMLLIRVLFLQYLYDLSDPETEDQLLDRESFQRFVGIRSGSPVPDFTTVWRFKELLSQSDVLGTVFATITRDLEAKGFVLRHGTIVDATVIESQKHQPLKDVERTQYAAQQQEIDGAALHPSEISSETLQRTRRMLSQIDLEARSTRKTSPHGHPKFYYGYKGHIGVDMTSKLIRRAVFTSANRQDVDLYPELVSGDEHAIYGDKAYLKKAHRQAAEERGAAYRVLFKKDRFHPELTAEERRFNKEHARGDAWSMSLDT